MADQEQLDCGGACGSCGVEGCGSRTEPPKPTARVNIKHMIGVVSGKGGVGKSLVTSLLASEMARKGYKVGILDADITGLSIPKTFGIHSRLTADADGINPAMTDNGIKVMSINLMLPQDDLPVAWRGSPASSTSSRTKRTGRTSTTCSSTCLREPPTCS